MGRALNLTGTRRTKPIQTASVMDMVPRLSPGFGRPEHLAPLVHYLDQVPQRVIRVVASVPPRHFKSTTLHHWVPWLHSRHPWIRVLYLSYGAEFATENVIAIRDLEERAGIQFGKIQRQNYYTLAGGGCVTAAGFDGSVTGRGYHVIIIDDPHKNRFEAESRATRERVVRGYSSDVYTRQQPMGPRAWPPGFAGTSFVILAARWHEDDLSGNVLGTSPSAARRDDAPRYEHVHLPAIDKYDRALAPDYWPLEQLKLIRGGMTEYEWVSLYQGSPVSRSGQLFAGSVVVCDDSDIPSDGTFGIGVDLAHTAKTRSDRHAIVVMQRRGDDIYVRDVREQQGRLTSEKRLDHGEQRVDLGFVSEIRAVQLAFPGARVVQYIGGREDIVLSLLGKIDPSERVHIEPRPATGEKQMRATPFAVAWNAGRVKIPRSAPWASSFVGRLLGFTGLPGGVDDVVDAASAAFDVINESDGLTVTPGRVDHGGGLPDAYTRGSLRSKRGPYRW